MKIKIILLFSIVMLLAGCIENKTEMNKSKNHKYYLGIIKGDSTYVSESDEKTKEIQLAHRANIRRLADLGLIDLAGPFWDTLTQNDWSGLFFYNVETKDSADILAQTDPAVQAGRLYVENYSLFTDGSIVYDTTKPMQMYSTLFFYKRDNATEQNFDLFIDQANSDLGKTSPNSSLPVYGYSDSSEFNDSFYALLIYDLDTTINYREHIQNNPFYDTTLFTSRFVNWYAAGGIALKK